MPVLVLMSVQPLRYSSFTLITPLIRTPLFSQQWLNMTLKLATEPPQITIKTYKYPDYRRIYGKWPFLYTFYRKASKSYVKIANRGL